MSPEEFEHGMRVLHPKTRRHGRVVSDAYSVCCWYEVAIRFDGESAYQGVDFRELMPVPPGCGWLDPLLMTAVN